MSDHANPPRLDQAWINDQRAFAELMLEFVRSARQNGIEPLPIYETTHRFSGDAGSTDLVISDRLLSYGWTLIVEGDRIGGLFAVREDALALVYISMVDGRLSSHGVPIGDGVRLGATSNRPVPNPLRHHKLADYRKSMIDYITEFRAL